MEESLEVIRTVFCDATNTWAIELKETGEAIGAMESNQGDSGVLDNKTVLEDCDDVARNR